MQAYCNKCGKQQEGNERNCSKCGAPFGGELWVIMLGLLLVFSLPLGMALLGKVRELLDVRFFFWYELPILLGTAILYDYHPMRRSLFFWGGALVIIGSLVMLLS